MKEFIDYLLTFDDLNEQQISLITGNVLETQLKKDDYFAEAEKVVRQTGFITEGVLRNYYYNHEGEEITKYFVEERNMVSVKSVSKFLQPLTCKPLQTAGLSCP
jgi:hypothetical protein